MDGQSEARAMNARASGSRGFTLINLAVLFWCYAGLGASPFFRPESTVILLAGLPGDLESESAYREQFQSWLEILDSARPKPRHSAWRQLARVFRPDRLR